jgi:hypothetical protein
MIDTMSRTVRSPDGRTWTIERVQPESALAASKQEPYFWGSVIVTAILIGVIVFIVLYFGAGIIFVLSLVLFVIWLLERGFSTARPNLRAHTDGPPTETLTWRTTHRYGLSKIEDRIAAQIEQGRLEAEPPGSVLVGI